MSEEVDVFHFLKIFLGHHRWFSKKGFHLIKLLPTEEEPFVSFCDQIVICLRFVSENLNTHNVPLCIMRPQGAYDNLEVLRVKGHKYAIS